MTEKNIRMKIDHPNLIKMNEAIEQDEYSNFVLNLIPGGDLFHLIGIKNGLQENE